MSAKLYSCLIVAYTFLYFYGTNFVTSYQECEGKHECINNSECVKIDASGESYNLCICKPGFIGWNCSIPLDYCNKHCKPLKKGISCQQTLCNQGQCINLESEPFYRCDCGAFYKGENCEIEDNPCSSELNNPCSHGDCEFVRGTNQVNCHCHPGWTTNPNQTTVKYTWNGTDVFISPPCIEEVKRGITGSAPSLGLNAKVLWYMVLVLSTITFLWLLSSTLYDCFGRRNRQEES